MPGAPPPKDAVTSVLRYLSPWYAAYLILGVVGGALLPFLLPLALEKAGLGLDSVAYVTGAYYVGLLPAPLLGSLAERRLLFKPMFFAGFILLGIDMALLPFASGLAGWMLLLGSAGLGIGAISTLAPLFVIDFTPKREWETRIGWLQGINGSGRFIGLVLAGLLVTIPFSYGFWLSAALVAVALAIAVRGLPTNAPRDVARPPDLAWGKLFGRAHPARWLGGLLHHSHHVHGAVIRELPAPLGGDFIRLLLAWAGFNFGTAAFFAYYPLLMKVSYGVSPETTAFSYAASAGVGVALFLLAGAAADRFGPRPVLEFGLAMRLAGFVALSLSGFLPAPARPDLALAGFAIVMLAWPILSVSGTGLAAQLTPVGEGAAMGLLAASNGAATLIGTFLGGPLIVTMGYMGAPMIAIVGLSFSLLVLQPWRREGDRTAGEEPRSGSGP